MPLDCLTLGIMQSPLVLNVLPSWHCHIVGQVSAWGLQWSDILTVLPTLELSGLLR